MRETQGYVYILASKAYGTLYVGVTSDLAKRIWEHKEHLVAGFTKKHDVRRLVWYECHGSIDGDHAREADQGVASRLESEFNPDDESRLAGSL